jgi:hypothetical protein
MQPETASAKVLLKELISRGFDVGDEPVTYTELVDSEHRFGIVKGTTLLLAAVRGRSPECTWALLVGGARVDRSCINLAQEFPDVKLGDEPPF